MSKCGPDHVGNRTCKSERSVGAKDPCNDAAVDVARGFLADRALKPATLQLCRGCHPPRYPGGICKIRFWRDGQVGEGTQIRRHQARVTIHDCHIFHNLPISDSRAAYLKTRNTRLANVVRTTAEADRFAANLMPIGDQKKFKILAFSY